jgi:hypothetical protein
MKPKRRRIIRHSFIAVVTGSSALALQACGDSEPAPAGGNTTQSEQKSAGSDSDS